MSNIIFKGANKGLVVLGDLKIDNVAFEFGKGLKSVSGVLTNGDSKYPAKKKSKK